MKLKTLLTEYFKQNGPTKLPNGLTDYILMPDHIELFKEELQKCDEFLGKTILPIKEIKSGKPKRIVIGHDEDGAPIITVKADTTTLEGEEIVTSKLGFNTKPIIKIHSISLTPEVIDPQDVLKGGDGTIKMISMSDEETLIPIMKMVITWSPERMQDEAMKDFVEIMEEKAKVEKKEEFTVTDEKDMDNVVNRALDMAMNLDRDEYKKYAIEKEIEMVDDILSKVKKIMLSSPDSNEEYRVMGKRGILVRLTKDSLDTGDNPSFKDEDAYIVL